MDEVFFPQATHRKRIKAIIPALIMILVFIILAFKNK